MPKIRILVVDDAVVIRKIVTDALASDPELEVVGTAPNGRVALQKIPQLNPDVVTLDIEMPEMNGIETLKHLRKDYPKLPVIMFSTLTEKGAIATLDALAAGASDYVAKPANVGSVTNSKETVKAELIGKIKSLAPHSSPVVKRPTPPIGHPVMPRSHPLIELSVRHPETKVSIVTIGISTGGPNALAAVLPKLPANFPVPIVIVQHMPPMFTRLLAERLNAQCALRVVEAVDNVKIEAGTIYLAPGGNHLELRYEGAEIRTHLHQGPLENSCRPAADVLFRSVVSIYKSETLGVIMTGMGKDGFRGCELIRECGGQIVAQDKETSVVWGMPGYVSEAGLADAVVPLEAIPQEILRRVRGETLRARVEQNSMSKGV